MTPESECISAKQFECKIEALEDSVIDHAISGEFERAADYLHALHVELDEYGVDPVEYEADVGTNLRKIVDWARDDGHPACVWYPEEEAQQPTPDDDRVLPAGGERQ